MKMKQEVKRIARKVHGKLTTVFDPEHLEVLARQHAFIQRSSSKLRGRDFVELMTTALLEDPSMSLEGLCDTLGDLNPHAQMTPQALHQPVRRRAEHQHVRRCQPLKAGRNVGGVPHTPKGTSR